MNKNQIWQKKKSFLNKSENVEAWFCDEKQFNMNVRYGKPLNINSLRSSEIYSTEAKNLEKARIFFDTLNTFDTVASCPVCETLTSKATPVVKVWSATYMECSGCGHGYCDITPSESAVTKYYSENILGNTYYTNPDQIENRIEQIYAPKLDWIISSYEKSFGRKPKSILDLGAGSAHFLETCKRKGLQVSGLEIDETYRAWAEKNFGIMLYKDAQALLKSNLKVFDVVTSFNVIEHIPQPAEFLKLYDTFSNEESLIVVETPKFNSVSSALQKIYPERIRGHLMPYIHVHMFSDNSLATILNNHGFTPAHAWFFGQDITELFYHLSLELKQDVLPLLSSVFNPLQEVLDNACSSDLMIFGAVKKK